MTKSIEEKAQKIVDLFFAAGARVSKKHYDEVCSVLTSLRNATIEECVEALPNEVIVEEVDEGAGFVPNTSDEAIADRSRNWIISEARQSLTALKSKEEKI